MDNDIRLIVEIKNKEPIELLELTKSLISLASQFNNYASENGEGKEGREAKLYVKEIRTGSVILELVEMATIGILPFMENANTVVGFASYIKKAYNYFIGKEETKTYLSSTDYRDLSQIINPIANDSGSQLNISTTINGNVELHLRIDSLQANAVQNLFEKELKHLKAPAVNDEIEKKVLFTWYQARNDMKSIVGNKGKIESISGKPMNVIFEDDGIKDKMLHGDNPFTTAFVVDAKQQNVNGKLVAYKIISLHESFDIENP